MAVERDDKKRDFLDNQHDIDILFTEVSMLRNTKAPDARTGELKMVPGCNFFHYGFSCLGITRLNSHRVENKGCTRRGEQSTGLTFEDGFAYIVRFRPKISILENLQDIESTYETDEGPTSDKAFVIEKFEKENFTVVFVKVDARDTGSPKALRRAYFVVYDIPKHISQLLGLEVAFFRVHAALKLPAYDVEDFLMTGVTEATFCVSPNKGGKRAPDWKCAHEQLFSQEGLQWPVNPCVFTVAGFGDRETEVIFLADKVFPAKAAGWQFMDANLSADWIFGLNKAGRGAPSEGKSWLGSKLNNPWKDHVPTWTGKSQMAGRKTTVTGDVVHAEIRRIHPLEGFQMNLWSVDKWSDRFYSASTDVDQLGDLCGNSWSLFHYVPIVMAAFGAISWSEVESKVIELTRANLNIDVGSDDSSSALADMEDPQI